MSKELSLGKPFFLLAFLTFLRRCSSCKTQHSPKWAHPTRSAKKVFPFSSPFSSCFPTSSFCRIPICLLSPIIVVIESISFNYFSSLPQIKSNQTLFDDKLIRVCFPTWVFEPPLPTSLHHFSLKNSMGCPKLHCRFLQTNRQQLCVFLLAFAFLFLSASPSLPFLAQGRQISKLSPATLKTRHEEIKTVKIMRSMIGSRPPRCEGRCKSCGQCKAVQVPIVPTKKSLVKAAHFHANIAYSRGDDISNYKPMCWKCKCGDFFFNPW